MSLRKLRKRFLGTANAENTHTLKTSPSLGGSKDDSTSPARIPSLSTPKGLSAPKESREVSSQYVTNAMVREFRELIRYRYELDCKIWSRKTAMPFQRDDIREDMIRADTVIVSIRDILESWDKPEYFATGEEYQIFLKIKAKITKAQFRDWASHPPWIDKSPETANRFYDSKDDSLLQHRTRVAADESFLDDSLKQDWTLKPRERPNEPSSNTRNVSGNESRADQWPKLPHERLRQFERVEPISGGPSADQGLIGITPGPLVKSRKVTADSMAKEQPEFSIRKRAPGTNLPVPTTDELDECDSLFDTDEIHPLTKRNDKQPAFVVAILNAIVTEFALVHILQDLLHQASTALPDATLYELFLDILQRYHEDIISDPSTVLKPQVKEVLGIGKYREIIARRVLDDQIPAGLGSDNEKNENVFIKAMDNSEVSSKPTNFSYIAPESCAFRNMLNRIRELLLPPDLLAELSPVPRHHITYETNQETAILQRFQRRFEAWTHLEWDWWPLPDSMGPLSGEDSRVMWRCCCGMKRWSDLRLGQKELLQEVLSHRSLEQQAPHSCVVTQDPIQSFNIPFRTALGSGPSIGRTMAQARSGSSSAQSRYTPSGDSSTVASNAAGGANTSNVTGDASIAISPSNPTLANSTPGLNKQMWIIFGVEGPLEPLELGQINNDHLYNDQAFIRELRRRHRTLRGWLRILFSIWRLRYWEFVKFDPQPYGPNRAVVQEVDLPHSQDYEYTPRPPKIKATDEGVRHSFTAMVQACIEPCPLESLPFGHVCRRLRGKNTHYVDRIPKRLKEWTNDDDDPDEPYIWGIQARYKPCILAVWTIHTLIMGGTFGFWGWWQKNHPDDVQGASVPLTIAVALISLFWSTIGVIPSLR